MFSENTLALVETPVEGVASIRLNRPEARNAFNTPLRQHLANAFNEVDRNDSVRCVVLLGSGGNFAAGADLKEVASLGPLDVWKLEVLRYWKAVAQFPKPIVAAVAGYALGGGFELALHADVIIAARSAQFGLTEVNVGIMPGGGGTQRLMRAIGKYRAMKLMLTGQTIGAEEAYRLGLVSEVVEDAMLEDHAIAMASAIASRPALATRLIKEVALAGEDAPLATGLLLERRSFELLFDTKDQKEGMQAFVERRPPDFNRS